MVAVIACPTCSRGCYRSPVLHAAVAVLPALCLLAAGHSQVQHAPRWLVTVCIPCLTFARGLYTLLYICTRSVYPAISDFYLFQEIGVRIPIVAAKYSCCKALQPYMLAYGTEYQFPVLHQEMFVNDGFHCK